MKVRFNLISFYDQLTRLVAEGKVMDVRDMFLQALSCCVDSWT